MSQPAMRRVFIVARAALGSPVFGSTQVRRAVVCLAAACASATIARAAPLQQRRITGDRGPVVVFRNGLGDTPAVCTAVTQALAGDMTALTFSRPGYCGAPAAPGGRSPCAAAAEQRELLHAAGMPAPYVLVGHSQGGLCQYAYAMILPDEVAAIVPIDPTHPRHWQRLQQGAPAQAALVRLAMLGFNEAMRREFDDQARCVAAFDAGAVPTVPVRLLARGRFVAPDTGPLRAYEPLGRLARAAGRRRRTGGRCRTLHSARPARGGNCRDPGACGRGSVAAAARFRRAVREQPLCFRAPATHGARRCATPRPRPRAPACSSASRRPVRRRGRCGTRIARGPPPGCRSAALPRSST